MVRNLLSPSYAWFSQIDELVILGALPFKSQLEELSGREKVGGVVCLNEPFEMDHSWVAQKADWEALGVKHYWLPTPDFFHSHPYSELLGAVEFVRGFEGSGKTVYIHCKAGRTRSATIAACYLMQRHSWDVDTALKHLKDKRYQVVLRQAHMDSCQQFYDNVVKPSLEE